jgi:hypothetical protein
MSEILSKDESYRLIGACFEVYYQKGYGFAYNRRNLAATNTYELLVGKLGDVQQ